MIRAAQLEELHEIVNLKFRMFEDAGCDYLLGAHSYDSIIALYTDLYVDDLACHYVVEEGGRLVACTGAFIKQDLPYCFYATDYYGFIGDVYVLPRYRRQGYARELTKEAIQWLRQKKVTTIRLLATDEGRPLYEKLGFSATQEMQLHL